jgi:hypothetical protein
MDIKLPIANELVVPKRVRVVVSQGGVQTGPQAMLDDVLRDIKPAETTELLEEARGTLAKTQLLIITAFVVPSSSWLSHVCESAV